MVADRINSNLIAMQATQSHGLGRMIPVSCQCGVQFRAGAAIAVHVHHFDTLGGVFVGQNSHQHRREGVKATHLARLEILDFLAFGNKCLLEGLERMNRIRAKRRLAGIQHGNRRTKTANHGCILVITDFIQIQQVNLNRIAVFFQAVQHPKSLFQRTAASCAQQGRTIQNLNNVLFIQLSHFENLLFLFFNYVELSLLGDFT